MSHVLKMGLERCAFAATQHNFGEKADAYIYKYPDVDTLCVIAAYLCDISFQVFLSIGCQGKCSQRAKIS